MGFSLEERLFEKYHPATTAANTAATSGHTGNQPGSSDPQNPKSSSKPDPPTSGGPSGDPGGNAGSTTTSKPPKDPEAGLGSGKEKNVPPTSLITVRTSTDMDEDASKTPNPSQPTSPVDPPEITGANSKLPLNNPVAKEVPTKDVQNPTEKQISSTLPSNTNTNKKPANINSPSIKDQSIKKAEVIMCNGINGSNQRSNGNSKPSVEEHLDVKEDHQPMHQNTDTTKKIHIENTTCESAVL